MKRNGFLVIAILIYEVIIISLTTDAAEPAKANLHSETKNLPNEASNVTSNVAKNEETNSNTLEIMNKIHELAGQVFREQLKRQKQAQEDLLSHNGNNAEKIFDEEYPSYFFDHYYPSAAFNTDNSVGKKYPGLIDAREVAANEKDFGGYQQKKLHYSKSRKRALRPGWVSQRMRVPFSITQTNGEDVNDCKLSPLSKPNVIVHSEGGIDDDNWRFKEYSQAKANLDVDDVTDSKTNELTEQLQPKRWEIQSNELIAYKDAGREEDISQSKSRNIMDPLPGTFAGLFNGPMPIFFQGQEFNYDNPNKWFLVNRQCAGHRQSPIALFPRKAQPADLSKISFEYYDVPLSSPEIHNNGHTAEVTINTTIDGTRPSITGGGIDDIYEVTNVHFHWGSVNTKGSEHAINGRKYDLEMHIVHKNIRFPTMKDALADPFGIAVLGVLFKKSESSGCNNTELSAVYDALPSISDYESVQCLEGRITMNSFLGDLNTNLFYTYRGSLTTPPCAEAVTWFVFPDIIPINSVYLERFFTLYDERGLPLLNNFRPLQSSLLRRIYYRKGGQ